MKTLNQQQMMFQAHILNNDTNVMALLEQPPSGSIQSRLDVYREGYYLRLIEVIQSDFETLHDVLGDDAFSDLTRDYIEAYPSHYFTLDDYAKDFALFVKQKCSPLQYEIAHFEWAIAQIRMVKPEPFINEKDLKAIDPNQWGGLSFSLQNSALLYHYEHPVLHFYENQENKSTDNPTDILIWQKDNLPFYRVLSPADKSMFCSLKEGKNFITICDEMCALMSAESVPGFVADKLKEFIRDELITEHYQNLDSTKPHR